MNKPRRPVTAEERALLLSIRRHVTFLPGHPDKRFIREMCFAVETSGTPFEWTEAQAAYLQRIAHRYRRQMPTGGVE